MSYQNCSSLSLYYETDFCLPVGVVKDQDEFTVSSGWIAGAFFLGLFVGVGIVLLLARPFLRSWEKKKQQDEEIMLEKTGKAEVVEAHAVNGKDAVKEEKKGRKKSKAGKENEVKVAVVRGKSRFWRRKPKGETKGKGDEVIKEGDIDPAYARGMVDIMLQTTSTGEDMEMADQDMSSIVSMERGLEEEKATLMLKTLAILLRKKAEKREITQNFYQDFLKKTEEDLKDMGTMIDREKEEAEEKLKNDPNLSKDTQTLETEMQKLQTKFNNKQAKLQRDFRDKIRLDLLRSSGMPEADVEEVIAGLMGNMAQVEEKIGLEQARQRRALEQRLAKRKQAMEYQEIETQEKAKEQDEKVKTFRNLLENHTKDGSLLEKQRDTIVTDYANDLDSLRKYHANEFNQLRLEKFELLQQDRLDSFYRLNRKHDKEKAALLHNADKSTNTSEFIKLYHDLMTKQYMEKEALSGELDMREVQELHKLKQESNKKESKAMDQATEKLGEQIEGSSNITSKEAAKIMKLHKAQMDQYNAKTQRDKQAMLARLQEKLQQRLEAADEAEARDQKEQETLKEQQMATLNKVLATNLDLSEDAKERILKEHEQNMQSLSNQLMRSKIRQQKSLEIKLNQKKAKLAELKQKREQLAEARPDSSKKEKANIENMATSLDAQIAKEEESFEEARKNAVSELRRQLSQETEDALKQQDEEIGLLIGRLQVGQARRKAIIEKQDAVLKNLQDNLERQVSSASGMRPSMTDTILNQHYAKVSHLNEQLQRHRDGHERRILEKLAQKRAEKEEEIEIQLEQEAHSEYTEKQKRGAGYASLALMQSFLEQRHAKALNELELEMKAELEKSKNELNSQLEVELRRELDSQRQNLLTQLAAVSDISPSDLQNAVKAATGGQTDSKLAKRLAKDLKENVERAKSALSMSHGDPRDDDLGLRRSNTDFDNKQSIKSKARKGSAASTRPKSAKHAFVDEEEDDDDYYYH